MAKDNIEGAPKKKGSFKKLLFIGVAAIALIGAGAGAGIYFGALQAHEAKPEDHFPKLVERSEGEPEPAAEGDDKEAPPKVGTVSVPNDKFKVDPRNTRSPITRSPTASRRTSPTDRASCRSVSAFRPSTTARLSIISNGRLFRSVRSCLWCSPNRIRRCFPHHRGNSGCSVS
jgi:hypothetical protein